MRFLFYFIFFINFIFGQQTDPVKLDVYKNEFVKNGLKSFFAKDTEGVVKSTDKLLKLYKKNKDSMVFAKYFQYKAMYYELKYRNDSAFYYYNQSKNISKVIGDSLEVGRRLLSIAFLQRKSKDFLGSEISSIEALLYLEPIEESKFLERIHNNLGLVSDELNQEKEALIHYDKALFYNQNNNNNEGFLYTINNIGLLYQQENKHKKAITYFKKGLAFDNIKIKYPVQYALLLENIAFSSYSLDTKEKVLEKYREVLEIRKKYKEDNELPTTHLNIANYYNDKKQLTKAKHHAIEALKYAKQTHNNKRWLEALELLSQLTTGTQSKTYLQEYITLNDSLVQQERRLKNQFAKIRYETDKKEKENTFLKGENEKKQAEITYHKQQTTIGWLASAASILLFVMSVSFFTFRRKKLLYQAQLQKAQVRERERKQIAKSLHDEVAGDLRLLHRKLEKSQLLEEAQKLEEVKENVRNLSHQLSSVSFKKVNFVDQIINLVSDYFSPNFIIRVHHLKEIDWEQTNSSIKRLLYLSIRESIQNCLKHAEASKIDINFSVHKKLVHLNISDNGIGFDTETSKKGIGLQNIEERVEELHGKLTITSEKGKGTNTSIQVPLNV